MNTNNYKWWSFQKVYDALVYPFDYILLNLELFFIIGVNFILRSLSMCKLRRVTHKLSNVQARTQTFEKGVRIDGFYQVGCKS